MNNEYFHCCSLPLNRGSIIHPGNWGRMLRLYKNHPDMGSNNWITLLREQTFELIRLTEFPDKPSRLKSCFVFETIDLARDFISQLNRGFDLIYKVRTVDQDKPLHKCCIGLTMLPNKALILSELESRARRYWSGTDIKFPELVTESGIEIIEQLL